MSEAPEDKENINQNSEIQREVGNDNVIVKSAADRGQEERDVRDTGDRQTDDPSGTADVDGDTSSQDNVNRSDELMNTEYKEDIVNDKYLPDVTVETEADCYKPKKRKNDETDNNVVSGCAIVGQSSTSTLEQTSTSTLEQTSTSSLEQTSTSTMEQSSSIALEQSSTSTVEQSSTSTVEQSSSSDSQSYSSDFSSMKDSSSNLRPDSSDQTSHDATDIDSLEENLKVVLPPLREVDGATAAVSGASAPESNVGAKSDDGSVYHIKWINFKSKEVPIITQNENGPCPLLAIMNILLLKGKVKFAPSTEYITPEQVMTHLGDCILENAPKNVNESLQLNYQQNMSDGMAVIHKLQTGLDVNVKFTGVQDFEYTPECILFDLLAISLYHGWLVDPQNEDMVRAVGKCSYNQLVEKIITQRSSDHQNLVTEALIAESFLDKTASQLTYHGLCELVSTVKEDELCVFFRNNHFSTMHKHQNELFLLVTDQGFLSERNIVWETLSNVEGDCHFVDCTFRTYRKPEPPADPVPPTNMEIGSEEQVDHDYLLAMSLQQEQQITDEEMAWKMSNQQQQAQLSDHELAARLQAEEDQRAADAAARQQMPQRQQQHRPSPGGSNVQNSGGRRSRERERDRDRDRERDKSKDGCCIL